MLQPQLLRLLQLSEFNKIATVANAIANIGKPVNVRFPKTSTATEPNRSFHNTKA